MEDSRQVENLIYSYAERIDAGDLVDWLNGDWGVFFILTAVMVIPSLICLWFIKDKLKLREK